MYTVKIVFLAALALLGLPIGLALVCLLLPVIADASLRLRGECAMLRIRLRPVLLPFGFSIKESVTCDSELGLIYCGASKRFGRKVLEMRGEKRNKSLIRAILSSMARSSRAVSFTAFGALAGLDEPDKAVLAAGGMQSAVSMLACAFPKMETGFCVVPDFTGNATKLDIKFTAKLYPAKLILRTIEKYCKSKGDKNESPD